MHIKLPFCTGQATEIYVACSLIIFYHPKISQNPLDCNTEEKQTYRRKLKIEISQTYISLVAY